LKAHQTKVLRRTGNSDRLQERLISVTAEIRLFTPEVAMKAEKEILDLLREIRDFVQILAIRDQLTPLMEEPVAQRNCRSWFLCGHRTHPRKHHPTDGSACG
jgi:hypothetical protein